MSEQEDWGSDPRRVRPLPPRREEVDAPAAESQAGSWAWAAAGLAVLAVVVWALWPDGGDAGGRRVAAPTTTAAPATTTPTTVPPTTAPSVTSPPTTTFAPAPPPPPARYETTLGPMTWRVVQPAPADPLRWVTNPVFTDPGFAFLAGSNRLSLHTSDEGRVWATTSANLDLTAVDSLDRMAATDEGLVLSGTGFGRPRAWISPDGSVWTEIELPLPRPPGIGPLTIWWHPRVEAVPVPGGFLLWGGAWFRANWSQILAGHYEVAWDAETEELVARSPRGEVTRFGTSFTAEGDAVHIVVTDAATGLRVHDSVVATGGFDAELVAAALRESGGEARWRPIVWLGGGGDVELVEPAVGGFRGALGLVTVSGEAAVAAGSLFPNFSAFPEPVVIRSAGGREWDLTPADALEGDAALGGAASDGEVALLLGSSWLDVELAEQVTALTEVGTAFVSRDGVTWEAHREGLPTGGFDVSAIGGGRLGFVATSLACPTTVCEYRAWLSADGTRWDEVPLATSARFYEVAGVAVGAETVVVLGTVGEGTGVRSNIRAWVGRRDG